MHKKSSDSSSCLLSFQRLLIFFEKFIYRLLIDTYVLYNFLYLKASTKKSNWHKSPKYVDHSLAASNLFLSYRESIMQTTILLENLVLVTIKVVLLNYGCFCPDVEFLWMLGVYFLEYSWIFAPPIKTDMTVN